MADSAWGKSAYGGWPKVKPPDFESEGYDPEEHGFFRDLVHDIKETIVGLGPGFKAIFTQNPITTFKQIGKAYSEYYSDVSNIWNHPLQVITDALSIVAIPFTGGASLAARGVLKGVNAGATAASMNRIASTSAKAYTAVVKSRSQQFYIMKPIKNDFDYTVAIPLHRNAYTRAWQKLDRGLLNRLVPEDIPVIGYQKRFIKAGKKYRLSPEFEQLASRPIRIESLVKRLKPHERGAVALNLTLGGGRSAAAIDEYARFVQKSGEVPDEVLKVLTAPKTRKAYESPSLKQQIVQDEMRWVSEADSMAKLFRGDISPDTVNNRAWNVLRAISGAKYLDTTELNQASEALTAWIGKVDEDISLHERALDLATRRTTKRVGARNKNADVKAAGAAASTYTRAYTKAQTEAYRTSPAIGEAINVAVALNPLARQVMHNRAKSKAAALQLDLINDNLVVLSADLKKIITNNVDETVPATGLRYKPQFSRGKNPVQLSPLHQLSKPKNLPGSYINTVYPTGKAKTKIAVRPLTDVEFAEMWKKWMPRKNQPRSGHILDDGNWGEARAKLLENLFYTYQNLFHLRQVQVAKLHGTNELALQTESNAIRNLLAIMKGDVGERRVALAAAKAAREEVRKLEVTHKQAVDDANLERASLVELKTQLEEGGVGLKGGTPVDELKRQFEENDWDIPVYFPNLPDLLPIIMESHGLSAGAARKMKPNKNLLAETGRIALDPRNLTRAFFLTIREHMKDQHHEFLLAASTLRPATHYLKGELYIKSHVSSPTPETPVAKNAVPHPVDQAAGSFQDLMRTQEYSALSRSERAAAEDLAAKKPRLSEVSPEKASLDEMAVKYPDELTTPDKSQAMTSFVGDEQMYYVIKESDAKAIVGEYRSQHKVIDWMYTKPTGLWRYIVLGLRPAFLINNMVGNLFLHALTFNGLDSVKGLAYVTFAHPYKHVPIAEKRTALMAARRAGFEQLMWQWFPDTMRGTFGMTYGEGTSLVTKVQNFDWNNAFFSFLPLTAHLAERNLRKAQIYNEIRSMPDIKAVYSKMDNQTRDWNKAADMAFERNPNLRNAIAESVNNSMGDYLNMSHVERHLIRQVWPFYSWYRAIGMIALRMPAYHPLKLTILRNIGQIGADYNADKLGAVPSFLAGSIGLGGLAKWLDIIPGSSNAEITAAGRAPLFLTSTMNPFQTVVEELEFAESLFTSDSSGRSAAVLAGINPIIQGVLETATGRSLLTGAPIERPPGFIPGVLTGFAESLPQYTILKRAMFGAEGTDKTLYLKNVNEAVLSFLGFPMRSVNLDTAKYIQLLETGELEQYTITAKPKAKEFNY